MRNLKDYFKIAVKNLKRRKLRSYLTILGIIISISIIFILISLSIGLESAIQEQFRQFGTDKFFIQPRGQLAGPGTGGAVELTQSDIDVIKKVSGVKDYTYWTASSAKIEFKDEIRYAMIAAVPLDHIDVYVETGFVTPDEGRFIKNGDSNVISIGYQYKYKNFFKTLVQSGDNIKINEKDFKVRGILKSVGNPQDDKIIYMSDSDFRNLFPEIEDRIDQIAVQINEGEDINLVASQVEKKLRSSRDVDEKTQDFSILTPEELLASFGNILNILTGFLLGVAAISLLVGAIGIANTMYTSVLERTSEIGVMKAVGAKNSDILTLFTIESGLLGFVGGVLGILLGIAIAQTIEFIASVQLGASIFQVSFPWYLILGSLAFAFIIGSVSGILPAYQASRIRPVEALRYE